MSIFFPQAERKIIRAEQHRREFDAKLAEFRQSPYCVVEQEHDPHNFRDDAVLRLTKALPADLDAIVGDEIHNARSALDHLAWEIVAKAGGTLGRDVKFPLNEDIEAFKAALGKADLVSAGDAVVALLVHWVRPSIGDGLALLNKLDNIDKHRKFIELDLLVRLNDFRATVGTTVLEDREENLTSGSVVLASNLEAPLRIERFGTPSFRLVFRAGQGVDGLDGLDVASTLDDLRRSVVATFLTISDAYGDRTLFRGYPFPPSLR